MGAVALGAMVLGTAISAYGSHQQGKAQKKLYEQNATIAGYQAQDALFQGEEQVRQIREAVQRTVSGIRAGGAGSGFNVNKGTMVELQADAARQGALDVARARYNAQRKAWGYTAEASGLQYQGDMAKQAGTYNAIGGALGGIGNIYGAGSGMGYWGVS